MLKKLLPVALSITVLAACGGAKDTAADEAKLKSDSQSWFDKYNAGDADGVASLYADDALVLPDRAPGLMGRAAFRTFIAADMAKSKAAGLAFKNGGVTGIGVSGDVAWISGTFLITDGAGTTVDTGKYLSVHRRVNNAWLYVRDTWNSDTEPATELDAAETHASSGSKPGIVGKTKGATKGAFSKIKGVFHR